MLLVWTSEDPWRMGDLSGQCLSLSRTARFLDRCAVSHRASDTLGMLELKAVAEQSALVNA